MRKIYILTILLLASSLVWQSNAQSQNDICEDAILVDCGSSTVGDTTDATIIGEPQEVCGTTLNTAPGEWYSIQIPADGFYNVTVDTFGSVFDTKLGVFSGACDALLCIGGNDDSGGVQSAVSFIGTASETYTIYVTGFGTNTGEYTLNVTCEFIPPATIELPITLENQSPAFQDFNGSFTQAIANPDATGLNTSATVAENTVPANASFAGVNFGLDTPIDIITNKGFTMSVWSPIPNTPVLLKLENATTGVNAERAATTTTTSAWETVSFDFSTEGDLTFESVTIFMNFNVTDPATQVYYWDNLNQFNLNVGGTSCANALEVTPGVYNDVFIVSDSGGSANVTDDLGPDALWYSYTPIESGTININSCISDPAPVDTRLFVYTDGCDTLTLVDNDDDGCDAPNGFGSLIEEINVIGGQEYLIEWMTDGKTQTLLTGN